VSGRSGSWLKVKCPDWKAEHKYRHLMFEGPKKPAPPSERELALRKKLEELGRVPDRLRGPELSQGMAREPRRHEAFLEPKITRVAG
jgi:hypothetical protein